MQNYSGPIRRLIKKTSSNSEFKVDGTMGHLESRNAFIKQSFTLEQRRSDNFHQAIAPEWIYEEEKEAFGLAEGSRVPFKEKPVIEDRLLLNKSFRELMFKPYNAVNYLKLEPQTQARLTPLLCSEKSFNNITKPPKITYEDHPEIQEYVWAQVGEYNRFWFGALRNYDSPDEKVDDVEGDAPFFMSFNNYQRTVAVASAAQQPPVPSVWGVLPQNLASGQILRPSEEMFYLGENFCGQIQFKYNAAEDLYESEPFTVHLPNDLTGQLKQHSTYAHSNNSINHDPDTIMIRVPSMKTRTSELTPYNYFFVRNQDDNPRNSFPTANQMHPPMLGGGHEYDGNFSYEDFVPVACGTYSGLVKDPKDYNNGDFTDAQISHTQHQIYMFVPAFRIVRGHKYSSVARPRRFAPTFAQYYLQNFKAYNQVPLFDDTFDGTDQDTWLQSTTQFWAKYYSTKYRNVDRGNQQGQMYDYLKIGSIRLHRTPNVADAEPIFCIQFQPDSNFDGHDEIRQMVNLLLDVPNRNNRPLARDAAELFCLWCDDNQDNSNPKNMKPLRLRFDGLGTFYNRTDLPGNFYGGKFANLNVERAAMQADRRVQIDLHYVPPAGQDKVQLRQTRYLRHLNMFKNQHAVNELTRVATLARNANHANLEAIMRLWAFSKYGSELHGEDQWARPFLHRSVFEFADNPQNLGDLDPATQNDGMFAVDIDGTNWYAPLELFPQRQADGTLSVANFEYFEDGMMGLYMPVRRQVITNLAMPYSINVECEEPFLGYTSGTNILDCKRPLNTNKFGENFPLSIQDYSYYFSQSASELFKRGYVTDEYNTLVVNASEPTEFTTISEKYRQVNQDDKDVLTIAELISTPERHSIDFTRDDYPGMQIEVRQGMFEYVFCWVEYTRDNVYSYQPVVDPVISGLSIRIRGRENLFVKSLSASDLEQISRHNCHRDAKWRELHESGQGVLLHLADMGLTEEVPFGPRERLELGIELTSTVEPTWNENDRIADFMYGSRQQVFNVALIRENQLLRGDVKSCRFEFYNEV